MNAEAAGIWSKANLTQGLVTVLPSVSSANQPDVQLSGSGSGVLTSLTCSCQVEGVASGLVTDGGAAISCKASKWSCNQF